jgi:hypothetical protein
MQKLQLHLSYHRPLEDVSWPISILEFFLCSEIGKKCYIEGYRNLPLRGKAAVVEEPELKKVTSSTLMGKRLTAQSGVTSEGTPTIWPVTEQNDPARGTPTFANRLLAGGKKT